jgi:predicted O-methyltransferase YrrM
MHPLRIKEITGDLPHMRLDQGIVMYNLITSYQLRRVLELGFLHGVSSLYIAGAVEEVDGKLITIDRDTALTLSPNIQDLADRAGLSERITIIANRWSYTYHLMELLDRGQFATFDLVYIDAGHNWDTTGFAVSLTAHLLKPRGWLILDDLDWTIEESLRRNPLRKVPQLRAPADLPGVRKAFELLVKRDNRYSEVFEDRGWGFARRSDLGIAT